MADNTGNIRLNSEVVVLQPYVSQVKDRTCLSCNKTFRSGGVQNRICSSCSANQSKIKLGRIPIQSPGHTYDYGEYDG